MKLTQLKETTNEVTFFSDYNATPETLEEGARKTIAFIQEHCKPYLEQKDPEKPLYRGLKTIANSGVVKIKNVVQDRTPRDSTNLQNMFFIDLIAHKGYKANRNNSTFATTSRNKAEGFGTPYVFYPMGEFAFTWGIGDMTEDISNTDVALYNVYSRRVYEDATKAREEADAFLERALNTKSPEAWAKTDPDMQKKIEKAFADSNRIPHWEAIQYLEKASPSEQRAWDWDLASGVVERLRSEKDSTLVEAMSKSGEIMFACKQYVAIELYFYKQQILPRL